MEILDLKASKEFSPTHHVYKTLAETPHSSISVVGWEPGQTSPIHSHPDADEIYHVLEGEGLFNDGTKEVRLGPGATVVFPAGEVHRVTSVTRMVLYRVQAGRDRHPEMVPSWPARGRHEAAHRQRVRRDRAARLQPWPRHDAGRPGPDRRPVQAERRPAPEGGDRAPRPAALHHQHGAAWRSLEGQGVLRRARHRPRGRANPHPRQGSGGAGGAGRHIRPRRAEAARGLSAQRAHHHVPEGDDAPRRQPHVPHGPHAGAHAVSGGGDRRGGRRRLHQRQHLLQGPDMAAGGRSGAVAGGPRSPAPRARGDARARPRPGVRQGLPQGAGGLHSRVGRLRARRRRPRVDEGPVRREPHRDDGPLSDGRRAGGLRAARDEDERRQPLRLRDGRRHPRGGPGHVSMTNRPSVTPALLEEYCKRFRNWDRLWKDDETRTLNFITPDMVKRAAGLVRQGKIISCALNFDTSGPQTGAFGRVNPLHSMVATGTDHAAGRQKLAGFEKIPFGWGFADDQVTMFLQCGTQWDGLGHIFHNGKMYGGRDATLVSSSGATRNGIEHYKDKIVSRGVLLDIARFKGVDFLRPAEPIYTEDLEACAAHQRVRVEPGDMVLVRTGDVGRRVRERSWGTFSAGDAPGLSFMTAPRLHDTRIAGIASDTCEIGRAHV